jgi:hypothetical protein
MRGHKLRIGVYWQGVLKQQGIKRVGRETEAMCICDGGSEWKVIPLQTEFITQSLHKVH